MKGFTLTLLVNVDGDFLVVVGVTAAHTPADGALFVLESRFSCREPRWFGKSQTALATALTATKPACFLIPCQWPPMRKASAPLQKPPKMWNELVGPMEQSVSRLNSRVVGRSRVVATVSLSLDPSSSTSIRPFSYSVSTAETGRVIGGTGGTGSNLMKSRTSSAWSERM